MKPDHALSSLIALITETVIHVVSSITPGQSALPPTLLSEVLNKAKKFIKYVQTNPQKLDSFFNVPNG